MLLGGCKQTWLRRIEEIVHWGGAEGVRIMRSSSHCIHK